jgi:protein-tyrosine phosphatase
MTPSTPVTRSRFLGFDALGGRRAALNALLYRGAAVLGAGARYRSFDPAVIRRLVFVCRGNICRSPFAQAVAESLGVDSTSFGIDAQDGAMPPGVAVRIAREHGFDVSRHRAAHAAKVETLLSDLIVAFEPAHLAALPAACVGHRTLLGVWSPRPTLYIHDPHGAPPEHFDRCFRTIEMAVEALAAHLREAQVHAGR